MACIVALSMLAVGAPAAAAGEDVSTSGDVHALENGEELYLVFGAELDGMTLDEYIEAHVGGEADATVNQYQDVEQVNINQQSNATAISIDGGEATAVQEANQYNDNEQFAEALAETDAGQVTTFDDVGTVNVVLGNGDGKQFDGWGIADKKGHKDDVDTDADQVAEAEVTQSQLVGQLNYNEQSTAFALADNESEALAIQQSHQTNQNLQQGVANATNVYAGGGDFMDQSADATVNQEQAAYQENVNQQDAAVAIAVGENSTATAIQLTEQSNFNEQIGAADASSVFASLAGMNIATSGVDDAAAMEDTAQAVSGLDEKADEKKYDDKKHDDKHDDKKDDKKHDDKKDKDHHKKGAADGDAQTATSGVAQAQEVEQMNVNLQSSAIAWATNGSDATAVQLAHQQNLNAQIGFADALNVYAGPGYVHDSTIHSETTSMTLGGGDVEGAPGIAFDTDAQQTNDVEQDATAQIQQIQYVLQENVNQQQAAVAIADDGGSADAAQVTLQENENVQFGAVSATNVWAGA
ncbi:hypothetical protein C483_01034 [Natrialba hulunbeirensis JCM 10989]|uniref:Uncharacterized protein n=1 Tax=Natrialba hulunbeirensis JCM 10989 TaxID=1227493 RepID=M0ABA7_9EURY|nr:hypothetical protein C483_01034 [Natrialba hulunbeirensis JCM 10989]